MSEFEFKFKFNDESMKKLNDEIYGAFKKVIRNDTMLGEIGDVLVQDIQDKTKSSRSVITGKRFKELSVSWILRRDRLATVNQTDPAYQASTSNLTFTGQLLRSLSAKILGPGKLELYFKGTRVPYKNLDGSNSGKPLDNSELARYMAEKGRPFVGVRPAMRLRVNRIVKTYVKRALIIARLLKDNG